MTNTETKRCALVRIKPEWLNPGEADIPYFVLEDRERTLLISPVPQYFRKYYPHTFFIPQESVGREMVYEIAEFDIEI